MSKRVVATRTERPVAATTMAAVMQHEYGTVPDEVLAYGHMARPACGPDEVLVEVHAAGVDRGTWHLMTGRPLMMRQFSTWPFLVMVHFTTIVPSTRAVSASRV